MRISSALLPLLATAQTCLAFITPSPSTTQLTTYHQSRQIQSFSSTNLAVVSAATTTTEVGAPGTADLDWSNLGFEFRPTKSHLRMTYSDGKWGEAELVEVRTYVYYC